MSGAPYGNQWDAEEQVYNVDLSAEELNFQTFETTPPGAPNMYPGEQLYGGNPYLNPVNETYKGGIFTPSMDVSKDYDDSNNFDDEPPLLEELGINIEHILQKTLLVLNPFRSSDPAILQDADLAGPLVFCVAFGGFLLLAGKVHFNYIYGIGLFGCASMYALLTLMATSAVTFGTVTSVLGYCLLPMVLLSGVNVLTSLQGIVGTVLTFLSIAWCSLSASKLFVAALNMDHQQPLVAYPCALLYGVFALITIF